MTDIRVTAIKSKYYLPKAKFRTAMYYALQYKDLKDECLKAELSGIRAITYDGIKVQTSNQSDPTFEAGVKLAKMREKIRIIEESAFEANGEIYRWLLNGVTEEGMTYTNLRMVHGIPCGKDLYYEARRRFYYILSQKI